jgi:hypothetical protein
MSGFLYLLKPILQLMPSVEEPRMNVGQVDGSSNSKTR